MTAKTEVFYYNQPVDSADQAASLTEYLAKHGWVAFAEDIDAVTIPMECPTKEDAATKSATLHMLISSWRLFWEHSDRGVFELPVYDKD